MRRISDTTEDLAPSTAPLPTTRIQALDDASVHRLCSSQVVADLSGAVKELVENALDSGATIVEVQIGEYGTTMISVSDNGSGISPEDFEGLAMVHHTSKLRKFDDLESINSFGFRGEALNSLCELSSSFVVTTRRPDDPHGASLTFDSFGRLASNTICPRSIGTTVTVEGLFGRLPVRRADFERNSKRQYQRCLRTLQAYGLLASGVRLSVVHLVRGQRQMVFSTTQGSRLEDNVATLFGARFLMTLIPLRVELTEEHISSAPLEPLPDETPQDTSIDMSISTDVTTNRNALELETLDNFNKPKSFLDLFSAHAADSDDDDWNSVPLMATKSTPQPISAGASSTTLTSGAAHKQDTQGNSTGNNNFNVLIQGLISKVGAGVGRNDNDRQFVFLNGRPVDLPKITRILSEVWRRYEMKQRPAFILSLTVSNGGFDVNLSPDKREVILRHEITILQHLREAVDALYSPSRSTFPINKPTIIPENRQFLSATSGVTREQPAITAYLSEEPILSQTSVASTLQDTSFEYESSEIQWSPVNDRKRATPSQPDTLSDINGKYPMEEVVSMPSKQSRSMTTRPDEESWSISPDIIQAQLQNRVRNRRIRHLHAAQEQQKHTQKLNDNCGGLSSEEYRKLDKAAFTELAAGVIGQFNLGFIIASVGDDLFILDQHACDEKARFEKLQSSTRVHQQPLIVPIPLDVSAATEAVVIEQRHVFEANGFKLEIDEDGPCGQRVLVTAIPFSKSVQFGVSDVCELASLLSEDGMSDRFLSNRDPNKHYLLLKNNILGSSSTTGEFKPPPMLLPKLMSMYASRACRSAVMIGTGLRLPEMRAIVSQLTSIVQPWNCPHGRPTLRHLVDLRQLLEMRKSSDTSTRSPV